MCDTKGQHIKPNQVNDPSLDFFFASLGTFVSL